MSGDDKAKPINEFQIWKECRNKSAGAV